MNAFMGSKSKKKNKKLECPSFTNFTIKVHGKTTWPDTVNTVLKSLDGRVNTFKMEGGGKVNISGYIDPFRLLKKLKTVGKKVEMVHWQYGECSNNLFQVTEPPATENGNGAPWNDLHPGCDGYWVWNGNEYVFVYGYGNMPRYNNDYPRIEMNRAYNHLECSGNAEDCSGHHMERYSNNSLKSSLRIPEKISASEDGEDPIIPGENDPKCYCSLM